MPIRDIDSSHAGIVANTILAASLDLCKALGIPALHPTLDAMARVLSPAIEGVYLLGMTGRPEINDQERNDTSDAVYLRYLPAAGAVGDLPVYGEIGPYVQPPIGQVRK